MRARVSPAWGSAGGWVNAGLLVLALFTILGVLTTIPGSGWSNAEGIDDAYCATSPVDTDEGDFVAGPPAAAGSTSATTGRTYCTAIADASAGLHTAMALTWVPLVLAFLGVLLRARYLIRALPDPFTHESSKQFIRLGFGGGVVVLIACLTRSFAEEIALESMSGSADVVSETTAWPALAVLVGFFVLGSIFGRAADARQRTVAAE